MILRCLDGLGAAKWPSILLVTLVPLWSYLNGWDGGAGQARHPVATVNSGGSSFRLWKTDLGSGLEDWCAQPIGKSPAQLSFARDDRMVPAEFGAGLWCAELPKGRAMPTLHHSQ
jgi:hypothetical protein